MGYIGINGDPFYSVVNLVFCKQCRIYTACRILTNKKNKKVQTLLLKTQREPLLFYIAICMIDIAQVQNHGFCIIVRADCAMMHRSISFLLFPNRITKKQSATSRNTRVHIINSIERGYSSLSPQVPVRSLDQDFFSHFADVTPSAD